MNSATRRHRTQAVNRRSATSLNRLRARNIKMDLGSRAAPALAFLYEVRHVRASLAVFVMKSDI